ncbi:MAG TPA: glycine--tRNA ligase subunit alpha [Thermoanaerobaculia bacterium]|nr:glycine--tRNA ligase subunit alpha [Thermoanaerobaculia bacterium]
MNAGEGRSLAAIAEAVVDGWVAEGFARLAPWDGELTARALSPPAFFALARGEPVRWVMHHVVRQPGEARYGRSPVRVLRSSQVRVLERPASADLFARFRQSFERPDLGLAGRELRWRECEWRVRDLGVEGAGWMLLMDGLLVARFLELSRVGSAALAEPACEITYGIERLGLIASEERSLERLEWAPGRPYLALRRREEEELSRHLLEALEDADCMARLEAEMDAASRALDLDLALPAYEAILRGNQQAEVLRARGAFRSLREARAGERLTELATRCRVLVAAPDCAASQPREAPPEPERG